MQGDITNEFNWNSSNDIQISESIVALFNHDTTAEIKIRLKQYGLPVSGTRLECIARLAEKEVEMYEL